MTAPADATADVPARVPADAAARLPADATGAVTADVPADVTARVSTDAAALTVSVNGEPRRLAGPTTLDTLVGTLTSAPSGVAAAVNETVVPRGQWAGTRLGEGDRIEVLTAVQGG